MREIKFRVWDKVANKWLDDENIYFDQEGEVYLIEERNWAYQSYMHKENRTEQVEIVRFTGLKDKNGKEIYEGDILSDNNYSNIDGAVVFNEENGYYEIDKFNYEPLHESLKDYDFEVIGNIYENRDLLEEK